MTEHEKKLEEEEVNTPPTSAEENEKPPVELEQGGGDSPPAETDKETPSGEEETKKSETSNKESEEKKKEETVEIPRSEYEALVSAKAIADEEVKRARADALNFRKRVEKEKESFLEFASGNILSQLLPLSDDLHRLIENGKDEIPEVHYNALISLEQRLNGIYEAEGVTLIKIKKGKTAFDPRLHQAVIAIPSEEVEANIIIDVTASGFVKGDRVLRPAKVVISKGAETKSKKTSNQEEDKGGDKEENKQDNNENQTKEA